MSSPCTKVSQAGLHSTTKVKVYRSRILKKDELVADRDNEQMIGAIDNLDKNKVLICAKSTRQIVALVSRQILYSNLLFVVTLICSSQKTGAMIDGEKVDRDFLIH